MAVFQDFCLRLDVPEGFDEELFVGLFESFGASAYFAFVEYGDYDNLANEHIHAYLRTAMRDQAIRSRIVRFYSDNGYVGTRGNALYSLKKCDLARMEAYERYCCKGQDADTPPQPLCWQGIAYHDGWMMQRQAEYWDVNYQLQMTPTPKPAQGPELVKLLVTKCRRAEIDWKDRTSIAREYIKLYVSYFKGINEFHVKSTVNIVSCLLAPADEGIEFLAKKIFPPDFPFFENL